MSIAAQLIVAAPNPNERGLDRRALRRQLDLRAASAAQREWGTVPALHERASNRVSPAQRAAEYGNAVGRGTERPAK